MLTRLFLSVAIATTLKIRMYCSISITALYLYQYCSYMEIHFLHLGEAPTFISGLEDKKVDVGSTLTLTCQVRGQPRPNITFTKDGKELTDTRYR